jgi:serine protease Do
VPCLVAFERRSQRLLTVLKLGERDGKDRSAEAVKGWLPVATQVLTADLAEALGLKGRTGVRVTFVHPRSLAEEAGLQVGDVLLKLDGQPIPAARLEDAEVFAAMVRPYRVGSTVALEVWRGGRMRTLEAQLAASPRAPRELPEYRDDNFEFAARDLTAQDRVDEQLDASVQGALVTGVENGGWASLAQLAVGDVVLEIGGRGIRGVQELEQQMKSVADAREKRVVFKVRRGVSSLFLELEPAWAAQVRPAGPAAARARDTGAAGAGR